MNRRTFVGSALSVTLPLAVAGCLDGDDEEEDDDFEPGGGVSREVQVNGENLLRRADSLIRQDDSVSVAVRIENAGRERVSAEVTLQMYDSEGETLGSPFTRQRGPIEPGRTMQVRFETGLATQAVGGYALTITELGGDEADTADGSPDGGEAADNETQNPDAGT